MPENSFGVTCVKGFSIEYLKVILNLKIVNELGAKISLAGNFMKPQKVEI